MWGWRALTPRCEESCRRPQRRTWFPTQLWAYLRIGLLSSAHWRSITCHTHHALGAGMLHQQQSEQNLHLWNHNLFSQDPQAKSSFRNADIGAFGPSRQQQEFGPCGEFTHYMSLTSAPPLPHSPPCQLYPLLSSGLRSSVNPQLSFSWEATKLSQLCLFAAFLVLGGNPGGEIKNQAQGKSMLTFPL